MGSCTRDAGGGTSGHTGAWAAGRPVDAVSGLCIFLGSVRGRTVLCSWSVSVDKTQLSKHKAASSSHCSRCIRCAETQLCYRSEPVAKLAESEVPASRWPAVDNQEWLLFLLLFLPSNGIFWKAGAMLGPPLCPSDWHPLASQ